MKRKDTTSVVPPSPAKKARGNSPSNSQQSSTFAAHVRRPKTVKFSLTPKTAASTSKNASPKEKPSVQGKKGKTMTSAKKRKATSPKTGAKKTITVSGKKGKTVTSAKKGKSISGKDPTAATTSKKASSKKIATTIAKKTTRKKVKIVVSPLKTVTSPKKRKSTSPKTGAKKTITVSGKKGKTVTSAKKGKSTSPKTLKKKPTVPGKERKTVTSTKTKGKSTTSKISGKDPTAATTSKKASSKKPATTIAKKTTRKNVKIVVSPLKTVTSPEKSKSTSPKITVRSASTAAKETAAAIQSTDDITSAVTPSPAKRARENSPSNSPPLNISTDSGTGATDSKDKHDVIENPFVSYFNHKPDAKYATKHKSMKGLSKHKDTHLLRKNMRTQSSFKNKFALEKFAYILSKSHEALEFLDYLDTAIASESFDKNKAENNYPTPPAPIIEEFGQYCDLVVVHPEGKQIMNELKKLMSIIHNNQHLLDLCYDLCKNDLPSQPEMGTPEYMSYAFDLPSRLGDDDNVLEENGYELVFVNYHDDILTKSQQINTGVIQEEQAKLITYLNQLDIHFLKFCKVFRTATEEEIGTITLDYFLQFIHLENAADITIGPFSNIVEELIKIGKHLNECDQNKRNEIVPLLMAKRNKIPYIDTKTNDQKFIEQLTLASRVQIMLHHMYPIECTPFLHDECCEYQKIPCDKLRYYYDGLWILKTGSGTYNLLGAIHRLSVGDIMDLYDILHDSMLKGKHIKKFADNLLPSAAFHDDTSKTEFVKLHNHLVDILKKFGREQAIEDLEDLILALKFHHAVADNNDESSTLFKISRKIGHTENLGIFSDTPNEDVTNEQGPPVDELNRKQTPAYPSKSDSPSVIRVKIEHAQRSSPYYQQGNDQMMVDDEKADTVEKPAPESSSRQTHSTVSSATENQQGDDKILSDNKATEASSSQLHLAAASGFEIAPLHSTPVTKSKVAMYQKLDSDITPIRSPQKNTNQSSGEATKSVTQDTHVRVVAEEELMHNCTVEEQCEAARRFFQNLYEEDAQFVKFISFALQGKKDLMSFESVQEFMKLQNHHPTEIRFKYLLNYAKTGYLSTKMQPSTLTSTLEYPTNVYDSLSHHITRVYDAFQENFDKWIDSSVHMKVMDPGKSDNGTGSQKQRSFQNIFEEYVARNISNSSFEKGIFEECARNMSSQQEGNIVYINKWGCWETYKV